MRNSLQRPLQLALLSWGTWHQRGDERFTERRLVHYAYCISSEPPCSQCIYVPLYSNKQDHVQPNHQRPVVLPQFKLKFFQRKILPNCKRQQFLEMSHISFFILFLTFWKSHISHFFIFLLTFWKFQISHISFTFNFF